MSGRLKVMTILGTRPEIIRLSATIKLLDAVTDHVLVHTGQNHDFELNEIFFRDLDVRRPDHMLGVDVSSLGAVLGSVLVKTEAVLRAERPDAVVILGDTNSAIAAVIARRMQIPVYHLEAGNRSFDENVPEEINRRMVDHVSDYNFAYTLHAQRNLLNEGLHPSRVFVTGSPMREVLESAADAIARSDVLEREELTAGRYLLASLHRQENVDDPARLAILARALHLLADAHDVPVIVSTHPRTRTRLESQPDLHSDRIRWQAPYGFHDYVALQQHALLVLSDSGTVSEESSILGFPAVTVRDAIERAEAIETGAMITTGVDEESILDSAALALKLFAMSGPAEVPAAYLVNDMARRVVSVIRATAGTHHERAGIRRQPLT
ncbi:MAG: UDP-N-acetylglucosamine 2-epimerase (non-hydrolyzing) [Pseudolysinimonas sp.]